VKWTPKRLDPYRDRVCFAWLPVRLDDEDGKPWVWLERYQLSFTYHTRMNSPNFYEPHYNYFRDQVTR